MIDDFTSEFRGGRAPIDAIEDRLDYLQELGINGIEFMPWTSWPGGDFSWGYDPVQFFAVEYRYIHDPTSPADKLFRLQRLINELHARNMHVVMQSDLRTAVGWIPSCSNHLNTPIGRAIHHRHQLFGF
jgi:pullulanase